MARGHAAVTCARACGIASRRCAAASTRGIRNGGLSELHADFVAAQRRPLKTRLHSAFIKTYKPGLDEGTVRTFSTMREYRQWCNETLPDWLGYQSTH